MDLTINGQLKDSWGDGTVFCLDFISVSILVVILYYNFARCYWEKLGKEYRRSLYYFLLLHVNLQLFQSEKFN